MVLFNFKRTTLVHICHVSKPMYMLFVMSLLSFIFILSNNNFNFSAKFTYNLLPNLTNTANKIVKTLPVKYILLWTDKTAFPFIYFGEGNSLFLSKKCQWTNCYVTGDRYILGDYRLFDVIAFNGPQLQYHINSDDLPIHRSKHQKYVYANIESAANYPVCSKIWDGFFNWTWTYKLNSNSVWGYFIIRNASNHIVGPSQNVHWINDIYTHTIDKVIQEKLQSKKEAIAWFVSNCITLNKRENYVKKLKMHLRKYNMDVDIYGKCGNMHCPKNIMNQCLEILEKNYYFYLAFENANSEDYVTEKILNALNHYTVPIVYGGANYSRFLPPKSYLNAVDLSPKKLAKEIYDIIQNPIRYSEFFKWKNNYSFHLRHESPSTDDYCNFCAIINNEALMTQETIYEDFDEWWKYVVECNFI